MQYKEMIDAGYRVLGIHPITPDGKCSCGREDCNAIGKHPMVSNWQHTPDWSDEQLEVMEELGQFDTGYGVLVRGLLVIDVDARNGGIESYARLVSQFPQILDAGLIVNTGSGGGSKHLYFSLPENVPLMQHLDEFKGIDFKSSGFVVGPGSHHASGGVYEIAAGSPYDISPAPNEIINLLKKPDCHRADYDGGVIDLDNDMLISMVSVIDPDCDYETWYRIGMAIHHATGGTGFDIWNDWSAKGQKYPGNETMVKRWHSFGKSANPITIATLLHYAEDAGWSMPVDFNSDIDFGDVDTCDDDKNIDTTGVDLLRPPGFVGKLASWINAQCRFPREHLASAAALMVVSNIAGMRHTDDIDSIAPNLFLFGVAGSATGKEAVLQATTRLMVSAGVSDAVVGGIKSEQEIYRNLITNQAAFYLIDEFGEVLSKLQNARKKGTTAYLEGVVGTLMSAYSKSDGILLVTGDLKKEIRKELLAEKRSLEKALSENEIENIDAAKSRLKSLDEGLQSASTGIKNPYLSIFGLTTPIVFNELVDFDMASTGLLGRALIVKEHNDNPPRKKIKPGSSAIPIEIEVTLKQLYSGGYGDDTGRVERHGHMSIVSTTASAEAMLDRVYDIFHVMSANHQEQTGLTAIPRRGYELVAKLSTVLAIPDGLRTEEHVRWAYAFVARDIDLKLKMAHSNSAHEKGTAVMARVMAVIGDDGATEGVIINNCRKWKKEQIIDAINHLVSAGHLVIQEYNYNGKDVKRYCLA